MSRVIKPGNKYMNTNKYDISVTSPSKTVRIHGEGEDYHKAKTLSSWLFIKYDMSYKTYRNKSKSRRNELRAEFEADTGVDLEEREARKGLNRFEYYDEGYLEAMQVLVDIGVPFSPGGDPLGID